ncbi:uncharacterized protein LOC134529986 [Bacillus rossius redtenbacheri]|uniref:uncharacterized protein LOC134529986 n=1 Tax=Bacillus rossius redtenbacheri TaxID=93214 RepID=UPI002FDECB40
MVRNRVRKTEKGNFSEGNMCEAVALVQNGFSLRKAATAKGLKYATLCRYVKKKKLAGPEVSIRMCPHYDCRKVFTKEQEDDLAKYLLKCSKMYYGLTTKDCRHLAYEMANVNGITCPKNWEEKHLAGIDWFSNFMKRHPDISLRSPETCSLSRATSFNKMNVNLFFDNLEKVYKAHSEFADGTRVFNLDETATSTVQKPQKVLAEKGSRQVAKCTSAERGTTVTTCCIVSASGNTVPPVMVFPRVHFKQHMIKDAPAGTLGLATPSGWMNSELFIEVMKHFVRHTNSSKDSPTLLLFDNHESHLSLEVINIARDNGVTIVTFPPHCSHRLQPLDVAVYKAFKSFYNAAVDTWMMQHPGNTLTLYDIAGIVKIAHERGLTPGNIMSGFRKSGIYPFDRHIFTDKDFLCSFVSDRAPPEQKQHEQTLPTTSLHSTEMDSSASLQSTEMVELSMNEAADNSVVSEAEKEELACNSSEQRITPNKNAYWTTYKSPELFKGYPKAGNRKRKCN